MSERSGERVGLHHAKTHLSELLRRVEAGEEITILRRGRAVARLVPEPPVRPPRVLGGLKGRWELPPPDTLLAPDPEIERLFAGDDPAVADG